MAVRATYSKLLIDEFDFSSDSNSLGVSITVSALDSINLASTGAEFLPGLTTGSITHGGYFSGYAAGTIESVIRSRLGTATAVTAAAVVGTTQIDCPVYVAESSWGDQLTLDMQNDALLTLSGSWPASGGLQRAIRVVDATLSATGAGTAYDFGATGSAGGKAWLFVKTITGTATSATITVESSATEGGVYATEGTFTFSAVGVQAATLSGTIDRWLRINVTSKGGATSFAVIAVVSVDGVTTS